MYLSTVALVPRYIYRCDPYYNNCHSTWQRWGRWVLVGILILFFILLLAGVLLLRRRRRRSRFNNPNATPMISQPAPGNYANPGYYNQPYAAPPGGPPQYGHGNEYGGYYGGQTGGVTQPGNVYQSK